MENLTEKKEKQLLLSRRVLFSGRGPLALQGWSSRPHAAENWRAHSFITEFDPD